MYDWESLLMKNFLSRLLRSSVFMSQRQICHLMSLRRLTYVRARPLPPWTSESPFSISNRIDVLNQDEGNQNTHPSPMLPCGDTTAVVSPELPCRKLDEAFRGADYPELQNRLPGGASLLRASFSPWMLPMNREDVARVNISRDLPVAAGHWGSANGLRNGIARARP